MKQIILFITIILLLSCATYRDVERYNEPSETFFYYNEPIYFNYTFYYWKGYNNSEPNYHWTPIKPTTPKKK